jgi:hypothetical protein
MLPAVETVGKVTIIAAWVLVAARVSSARLARRDFGRREVMMVRE